MIAQEKDVNEDYSHLAVASMMLNVWIKCMGFIPTQKDVNLHLRSLKKYDRNSPMHRKKPSPLGLVVGLEATEGFFELQRIAWEWRVGGDILF